MGNLHELPPWLPRDLHVLTEWWWRVCAEHAAAAANLDEHLVEELEETLNVLELAMMELERQRREQTTSQRTSSRSVVRERRGRLGGL